MCWITASQIPISEQYQLPILIPPNFSKFCPFIFLCCIVKNYEDGLACFTFYSYSYTYLFHSLTKVRHYIYIPSPLIWTLHFFYILLSACYNLLNFLGNNRDGNKNSFRFILQKFSAVLATNFS